MDQSARQGVDKLETEQEARSGHLAMGDAGHSGSEELRQPDAASPELKKIMVADECDAVAQRLRAKRHAEPAPKIFVDPVGPANRFAL